jgi:ATP-dependent DNA helicase RecG
VQEPTIEALKKLKLIINDKPTNAAYLLFAKDIPPYNVHIGRFKTASTIIDDRMLKGTLYELAEETLRYINSRIKVAFEITGEKIQRNEIFEYPLPALRELVLNALLHRDYMSPIDIQIEIFDQSITIYNPVKLYGDLTVEDLKTDFYQSNARNKLLTEAFYLTKDIEKYVSGFIRVRNEIKAYPTMQFDYQEIGNGFLISLKYTEQKITKDVTKDVTKENRETKILELIKSNPLITTTEIAAQIKLTRRTILREIDNLKTQNKIERVGGRKNGHWKIIPPIDDKRNSHKN